MPRLVVHVGPGKCGSTTIQQFLSTCASQLDPPVGFVMPGHESIRKMEPMGPVAFGRRYYFEHLKPALKGCETLVLSHEVLFQMPHLLQCICRHARSDCDEIVVIGYCRRQSAFISSAYSQWLFRAPARVAEVRKTVEDHGYDAQLFSGLERQFVACLLNDFHSARQLSERSILDWNASYSQIEEMVSEAGASTVCSVLPHSTAPHELLNGFCRMAGLAAPKTRCPGRISWKAANPSFHPDLVESINAVLLRGHQVPGPHEMNQLLAQLSKLIDSDPMQTTSLLERLKLYCDGYYLDTNRALCSKYGLDESRFAVERQIEKREMVDWVDKEHRSRAMKYTRQN